MTVESPSARPLLMAGNDAAAAFVSCVLAFA
jgi:hypothetical protein